MSTIIDVDSIKVTAINDGTVHLPPMYYPGLDFGAHPELVEDDGTYHIPAGCFLIQGDAFAVLVDAGIGPTQIPCPDHIAAAAGLTDPPEWIARGGRLPDALAAAGVAPPDINTVFLTHLHPDHIGWAAPDGERFFPNAEIICGAADWHALASSAPGEEEARRGLKAVEATGALRAIDAPMLEIAPGVTAHHTPGHTPGHYIVRVSSAGGEAQLLGDAVHHPLQLNDKRISFMLEDRPEDALRTREDLFTALEGRDVSINMAHFPGLEFHWIAIRDGLRHWVTRSR
jgi:glyoxylase-like metal-dependent hydrolase (beta-lactamase superfamily II)